MAGHENLETTRRYITPIEHDLMHLMPKAVKAGMRADCDSPERPFLENVGMKHYTQSGTIGFPTRATAEKGPILFQSLIDQISSTIKNSLGEKSKP